MKPLLEAVGLMRMVRLVILSLLIGCTVLPNNSMAQKLASFDFSRCLEESRTDSTKVLEIKEYFDIVKVKLETWAPCNGNFKGKIDIEDRKLNLQFSTRPMLDKSGNETGIIEVADCSCKFIFDYALLGLDMSSFNEILINGKTFHEIDEENLLVEIDVEIDSVKQ